MERNLTEFFRDLQQNAMRTQSVASSADTEFYLVKLLEGFAHPERDWFERPLALEYLEAFHAPAPNRSGKRRTGVALRYMPATSVFDRELRPVDGKSGVPVDFARRPLWLVRGVDRSGRNDFSTGHRRAD